MTLIDLVPHLDAEPEKPRLESLGYGEGTADATGDELSQALYSSPALCC